jgi:inorganic phosphate transporter, PiT family
MSEELVPLSEAQGFTANILTAARVISAGKLGLPASTTHVSVGTISGVGFATGNVETRELTHKPFANAARQQISRKNGSE